MGEEHIGEGGEKGRGEEEGGEIRGEEEGDIIPTRPT